MVREGGRRLTDQLKSVIVMQVLISWMDTPCLPAFLLSLSAIHLQHLSAFLSPCLYIFLSILSAVPHPN